MGHGSTIGEALAAYRAVNGLDPDPASSATWTCRLGPITLRLPNFRWRRDAVIRHDLHHLMTGYPCTMRGECQMAAWEFAAGRFPHLLATAFCLPLVVVGITWSPRSIWLAFLSGRRGKSLYGSKSTSDILRSQVDALPQPEPKSAEQRVHLADIVTFGKLIAQGGSWCSRRSGLRRRSRMRPVFRADRRSEHARRLALENPPRSAARSA